MAKPASFDGLSELRFDFGSVDSTVARRVLAQFGDAHVEQIEVDFRKSVGGVLRLASHWQAILINFEGTLIVRQGPNERMVIVAPRSVAFVRGGATLGVTAARGEHRMRTIVWPDGESPTLKRWIGSRTGDDDGSSRFVACKPISPNLSAAVFRLDTAISTESGNGSPLLMSVVYELVGRVLAGDDVFQLAGLPVELPPVLKQLTQRVANDPTVGYPLKDAAAFAGYSAFHFSRVFKQVIGYGFHEYVDRCRTEAAVRMLVSSRANIDSIASSSGFGTTQGLRDSVKEYLGVVPSELRAAPTIEGAGG